MKNLWSLRKVFAKIYTYMILHEVIWCKPKMQLPFWLRRNIWIYFCSAIQYHHFVSFRINSDSHQDSLQKSLSCWLCKMSLDSIQLVTNSPDRLKALGTNGSMQTPLSAVSTTPVLHYLLVFLVNLKYCVSLYQQGINIKYAGTFHWKNRKNTGRNSAPWLQ